ncbi:DNA polymerase I [Thermophagus xiamenensis]|jgi:DNA polymerase-1|uniref:DNA polymerase I n=1 Tax=Thermophagus xiamenensis TaxID=385682 RepID=A0A1I2CZR0_9BACT|nr:DNA polymerase I [Thermophagus xiamenensis]SFE73749.1 DNA polymerase I [Thermophagus xiamenensis]
MSANIRKLCLVDAYALIFRAYYAFLRNPRINSKGLNTSAIFGFTNSLLEVINRENPSHLAVAFDPSGPTFRNYLFPDYKANREDTPEDIKKAVPYIKKILDAFNIKIVQVDGYEADDVVGTLSRMASNAGFKTFMVTPDKDYAQLVTDDIVMYKPKTAGNDIEKWGVEEIKKKFSVEKPEQVIDLLALWGDSADNIPGCPGIGEKRAKIIIGKYGSIENVYAHIDEFSGKQKENLIKFKEQVELSKKLATIKTDVPIQFDEKLLLRGNPDLDKLQPVFEELEFKSLWEKITNNVSGHIQTSLFDDNNLPSDIPARSSKATINETDHRYFVVDTTQALDSLAADLSVQKEFCIDTETSSLDVWNNELVGLSFSFKKGEAYYVPVPEDRAQAEKIVKRFAAVLTDSNILKIGQNVKFDYLMLKRYGVEMQGPFFDTMIAHHLVQPGLKHNMDFLAETYLNYTPVSIEKLIGSKGKNQKSMRQVDINVVAEYAGEDADITFQLKKTLLEELKKYHLTSLFWDIEMPLIKVLAEMEFAGVCLDTDALKKYALELQDRIDKLETTIKNEAGTEFNVSSPKQVGEVLFDKLNLDPKAKKTKSGQYSTNEEILQKIRDRHPIIGHILEYRGLKKLLNTYVEALPKLINKETGRLHTSFNQAVVVTGRLSSSNPNLQNIPIREEEGREMRRAFVVPDENHLFLSADYSQIELRLMAHLSEDEHLLDAFNNQKDVHAATAARIFNVDLDEVTPDMRRKAKTANFGIIYGISAFGLSERLNISRSEAKSIIDEYFENFPGVKEYMNKAIEQARKLGYVETLFGRRRYLPDINSRNSVVRGVAERNAINAPIQGTAADIIKKAMVAVDKAFKSENLQSRMVLQVHDELNFEVRKEELQRVTEIVKREMESAVSLKVPLIVDIGVGQNWLEAH